MNASTIQTVGAAERAPAERAQEGLDIVSDAARVHAMNSRMRKRRGAAPPPSNSAVTRSAAHIEPAARDAMIAESAYFRSALRGFEPGHEVDDWLAAESEIDAALARVDISVSRGTGQ